MISRRGVIQAGELALALLRRDQLVEELVVGALDEGRQRLAGRREVLAAQLLGHGDRRVLVVVVVGAERHDDAARDVVGEDVLELAEEGGLRPAEAARSPLRRTSRQVDRQRLGRGRSWLRSMWSFGPRRRRGCRRRRAPGCACTRRRRRGPAAVIAAASLRMTRPPGVTMRNTCLPSCGARRAIGVRAEDDVGDAERARQELHVREHVALALGEDAGGGIEVGRASRAARRSRRACSRRPSARRAAGRARGRG